MALHRFYVSIFIDSHYEHRNRQEGVFECRGNVSYKKGKPESSYKLAFCFTLYGWLFTFFLP